jgi:hypothetical protein
MEDIMKTKCICGKAIKNQDINQDIDLFNSGRIKYYCTLCKQSYEKDLSPSQYKLHKLFIFYDKLLFILYFINFLVVATRNIFTTSAKEKEFIGFLTVDFIIGVIIAWIWSAFDKYDKLKSMKFFGIIIPLFLIFSIIMSYINLKNIY